MTEVSKAEQQRRAHEWVRLTSSDPEFDARFEHAKQQVDISSADFNTLVAVGEWKHAHAGLPRFEAPREFSGIISEFIFGSLGYEPDAEKGRLRLRVNLPKTWSGAQVENIRVGDALVTMRYARRDDEVRFELEQVAGAMPVRLIFEPVLTERFESIAVDGEPAQLNIAVVPEGVVAPVQIMLDGPRTVVFR